MSTNPIDRVKPEIKPGEKLCGGCWAVSKDAPGWLWVNFKYLDPTWLCPKCIEERGGDLVKIKAQGL